MSDVWFYKYLDLPHPPKWLVMEAVKNLPDMKAFESKATVQSTPLTNPKIVDWMEENIGGNMRDIEVTWTTAGLNSIGVHTDRGRNYALMYLLDQGGDNCFSTVYQQEGHPLIRERATHVEDRSTLKEIHTYVAEKGRWYVLDTRILHTVDNLERFRIAIQCSFDDVSHLV